MKLKDACSSEKSYDQPRQCIKKQRHHLGNRCPCSQSYGLSCSAVQMWELDHKEGWALNWFFWTVVLEKIFESPLICKEVRPVKPKRIFIARTDAEAAILPFTWCKELTHWKRPWGWERLNRGEGANRGWDGLVASSTQWCHQTIEQALVVREGQGSSVCCSPLAGKTSDTTKRLSNQHQHNQWYKTESFSSGV